MLLLLSEFHHIMHHIVMHAIQNLAVKSMEKQKMEIILCAKATILFVHIFP